MSLSILKTSSTATWSWSGPDDLRSSNNERNRRQHRQHNTALDNTPSIGGYFPVSANYTPIDPNSSFAHGRAHVHSNRHRSRLRGLQHSLRSRELESFASSKISDRISLSLQQYSSIAIHAGQWQYWHMPLSLQSRVHIVIKFITIKSATVPWIFKLIEIWAIHLQCGCHSEVSTERRFHHLTQQSWGHD